MTNRQTGQTCRHENIYKRQSNYGGRQTNLGGHIFLLKYFDSDPTDGTIITDHAFLWRHVCLNTVDVCLTIHIFIDHGFLWRHVCHTIHIVTDYA